jgi:TRADD-N domain-containing protein
MATAEENDRGKSSAGGRDVVGGDIVSRGGTVSIHVAPLENVAKADPGNIQEVAASQLALSTSYYESVLAQARRSFVAAIVSAAVGLGFFLAAVAIVLVRESLNAATLSAISGGIVETIAGLNFWLYGKTATQLDAFHVRLEQTQRYLLANSLSTSLDGEHRNKVLSDLVATVASQPVLLGKSMEPAQKH